MVNVNPIPSCSSLGCVFQNWTTFSYEPIKRKKDVLVTPLWPEYFLNSGKNMALKWILKLQFYN